MILSEAIEALCIATRADGRALRTVEAYRQKLAPMLAYLGDVPIASITAQDVRRFIVHLQERSTRMVKRYVKLAEVDAEQAHKRASPADNWGL